VLINAQNKEISTFRYDHYSLEIPTIFFSLSSFFIDIVARETVLILIVQRGANVCTKDLHEFLLFEFARDFIK